MAGLVVLLSVYSCIFGLFACASEVNPLPGPLGNEKQLPSSARGERSDHGILSNLGNTPSMEESAETTPETCAPKYADSDDEYTTVYDEVTEESAVPQHKTGSVTEDQSEETDSLYHDDNKDSRQPRSWTVQAAVVETTPAEADYQDGNKVSRYPMPPGGWIIEGDPTHDCSSDEMCGYFVYFAQGRVPFFRNTILCSCPEGTSCVKVADHLISTYYIYKCRESEPTEIEIIDDTDVVNATLAFYKNQTNTNVDFLDLVMIV